MLFLFPRHVFDEIWDLIESVSEGFPTYTLISKANKNNTMMRVWAPFIETTKVAVIEWLEKLGYGP